MAVGSKILNSEYNGVQTTINGVAGKTVYGTTGWGQTLNSAQVSANGLITTSQWNGLRADLMNAYAHQNNGTVPTPVSNPKSPPSAGAAFSISSISPSLTTTFAANISGSTMTVLSTPTAPIKVGLAITGAGVTAGAFVSANISGSGAGSTWTISIGDSPYSQTLNSITISAYSVVMYVNTMTSGAIEQGQRLNNVSPSTGIPANTYVTSWNYTDGTLTGQGTNNGGTYLINQVATASSQAVTSTKLITNSDLTVYTTLATAVSATGNVIPVGSGATVSSSSPSYGQATRITAWNGTQIHEASMTFNAGTGYSAAQAAAWFFNSGSVFRFTASQGVTASSPLSKDAAWAAFLSECGTITMAANGTSVAGNSANSPGTLASAVGFWQLTTVYQTLYSRTFSTTVNVGNANELTYPSNYYSIEAKVDSTSARAVITFRVTISDLNNPGGTKIDENVTANSTYPLISNMGVFYASGSYISVSGYLPTYAAIGTPLSA